MTSDLTPLEPLKTPYRLDYLTKEELDRLQEATLAILERTGVKFPSEKALKILADHGASVDPGTQIVRFPRRLVREALRTVPRHFSVGARDPFYHFDLADGCTYFCTDGCGVETVELESRQRRPSRKEDVGMMARIVDFLPGIAFYWPMVSSQEHGRTAPLHDLDASFRNTRKHVQSETIMGEADARYALEMSTVVAGSRQQLRSRPNFSLVICTIAPLVQDKHGIEAAMVLAEAGVPVGFLSMPTLGTTAPATLAGALAVGDAEIISGVVLTQLIHPGAPVFHSLMQAWADPSSGRYVSYPLDARGRYAPVEMAHHWGMPCLGACFGTDSHEPGTWQSGSEVALDSFMIGLTGAEWVTGLGLTQTYTRLFPESLIMDYELYQKARYALMSFEISTETLALDTVQAVGAGGHFLAQKHTRQYMRDAMKRGLAHRLSPEGQYRDAREYAVEYTKWILANHHPEPLDDGQLQELDRILAAADKELA
ncbi:MAG TPA: trimethylamine methyltransferase family protein [Anaerolineales bacterium]|nr:trimethylamine methyltransferase family protein [Anaerolineales bacterium]